MVTDMNPLELRQSACDVLEENILAYWLNLRDTERGGFYGQVTGDEVLVPDAPRGAILNARILWSFASAYRVLHKPEYLQAAEEAKPEPIKAEDRLVQCPGCSMKFHLSELIDVETMAGGSAR